MDFRDVPLMGCYPTDDVTIAGSLVLSRQYREAALALSSMMPRRNAPLPPFRLLSIHAIELAMNALLLHGGMTPEKVRGLQHNLAVRLELCREQGLMLRRRTEAHILMLTENRDYLVARYAPEKATGNLHFNRMCATVNEVCGKVEKLVASVPAAAVPLG